MYAWWHRQRSQRLLSEYLGLSATADVISLLGAPVGSEAGMRSSLMEALDSSVFDRLDEVPHRQSRLLLQELQQLVARSLAKLFDLTPTEKLEQAQFLEIGLPISRGGLGLPDLVAEAPNAYFASVLAVLQRWRDFLPDGSNFLQRWVAPSQPPSYRIQWLI
eukprot:m.186295 g.186295  ORF g.186295 m.186295 type:complete len:162 (+) comp53559_c0_seq7:1284-1769(+)